MSVILMFLFILSLYLKGNCPIYLMHLFQFYFKEQYDEEIMILIRIIDFVCFKTYVKEIFAFTVEITMFTSRTNYAWEQKGLDKE